MIFLGGTTIDSCNRTQEFIIKVWGGVSDKMISTHLVGAESDLHCCYGGEGLAEISPSALGSYLKNESSYWTKVYLLVKE